MVLLERTPPPSKSKRTLITPVAPLDAASVPKDLRALPASSSRTEANALTSSIGAQASGGPPEPDAFTWAPLGSQSSITPSKPTYIAKPVSAVVPGPWPAAAALSSSAATSTIAVSSIASEQTRQPGSLASSRVPSLGAIAQMHQGRDEVDEWHVRSHNAWEEREERPIGGSGGGMPALGTADEGAQTSLGKDLPTIDAKTGGQNPQQKKSVQSQDEQQDGSIIIHEEIVQTHLLAPREQSAKSSTALSTSQEQRYGEPPSAVTPIAPASTFAKTTPSTASMTKAAPISTTNTRPAFVAGSAESATPKASTTPHRLDPATRIARIETQEHISSLQRTVKDLTSKLHAAAAKLTSQKSTLTSVAEERDGWKSEAQRLEDELDRSSRQRLAYKTRAAEMSLRLAEQEWKLVTVSREERRKAQVQLVLCKNEATYQQNRALELDDQLKYATRRHDEVVKAIRNEAKTAVRDERAKVKELNARHLSQMQELEKEVNKTKSIVLKRDELAEQKILDLRMQLPKARSSSKSKEVSKIIESSSPGPFRPPRLPAGGAARALPVQPFDIEASKKKQRPPMQGASEPNFDEEDLEVDDAGEARGETPSPEQPTRKTKAAAQNKAKSTLANSAIIRAASSSSTAAKRAGSKRQYREDDGEETPEEDGSQDEDDYQGAKSARGKAAVTTSAAGKKVSVLSRAKASKAAAEPMTDVTKTPLLSKKTLKPRLAETNAAKAVNDDEHVMKKGKAMQIADIREEKENSSDKAEGGAKKKRKLLGNKAALGSLTLAGGEGTSSLNPNFALPLELSPVKQAAGQAKPGIGRLGGR